LAFKIRRTENAANFKAGETSSGGFPPFPVPAQKILPFPKTEIAGDFFRWERRVRIKKMTHAVKTDGENLTRHPQARKRKDRAGGIFGPATGRLGQKGRMLPWASDEKRGSPGGRPALCPDSAFTGHAEKGCSRPGKAVAPQEWDKHPKNGFRVGNDMMKELSNIRLRTSAGMSKMAAESFNIDKKLSNSAVDCPTFSIVCPIF